MVPETLVGAALLRQDKVSKCSLTTAAQSDKTPNKPPAKKVSKFPSLLCVASKHQAASDNTTPPLQVSFVSLVAGRWTLLDATKLQKIGDAAVLPSQGVVSKTRRGPIGAIRLCPRHDWPQPRSVPVCQDQVRPAQRIQPVISPTMNAVCLGLILIHLPWMYESNGTTTSIKLISVNLSRCTHDNMHIDAHDHDKCATVACQCVENCIKICST